MKPMGFGMTKYLELKSKTIIKLRKEYNQNVGSPRKSLFFNCFEQLYLLVTLSYYNFVLTSGLEG